MNISKVSEKQFCIKGFLENMGDRGFLTPLFYEDPHIFPNPPFFQILSNRPFPVNLHLHCFFFVLFLWPNGFYVMIYIFRYLSTRKTLLCVLCNKASSLLRSDTMWFFAGTLIRYHTHKDTHKDTQYTQGPIDCHSHINICQHHLLCAHRNYLYYIK